MSSILQVDAAAHFAADKLPKIAIISAHVSPGTGGVPIQATKTEF